MSEINEQNTVQEVKTSSLTINQAVAHSVAEYAKSPKPLETLVSTLANAEIDRRANALLKAFNAAAMTKKEIQKLKPDNVTRDEFGKEISVGYSSAKYEELKKLKEKLAKIEGLISAAVDKADYSKILDFNES